MVLRLLEMAIGHFSGSMCDSRSVGKYGEKLTERKLKMVGMFGRKGKILKNIYLPKDDGGTTEIDLVYITQKGIFVIESKNYSGWIFGNSKDQYWTQSMPNGTKNRFYNPIKQNRTHLKWLRQFLNRNIPLFSFIVFSERCELKRITCHEKNVYIMNRDKLYASVKSVWNQKSDVLVKEDIEQIYALLKPLTKVNTAVKQAHIDEIQQKLHPTERICPRCGAQLVLRTAKNGANAGNQFYGCSAFPKCRYTQNKALH